MIQDRNQRRATIKTFTVYLIASLLILSVIAPLGLIAHAHYSLRKNHLTTVGAMIRLWNVDLSANNVPRINLQLDLLGVVFTLTPGAASYLVNSYNSEFCRDHLAIGVTQLSQETAQILSHARNGLNLPNLKNISPKTLETLVSGDFDPMMSRFVIKVPELTIEKAKVLSQFKGFHLLVHRISELSPGAAKALAAADASPSFLTLNGFDLVSESAALALSESRAIGLRLGSPRTPMESLSGAAAKALSKFQGDLTIHVKHLPEEAVLEFSQRERITTISGLEDLSENAAKIFASHDNLKVERIRKLPSSIANILRDKMKERP